MYFYVILFGQSFIKVYLVILRVNPNIEMFDSIPNISQSYVVSTVKVSS